MDTAILASGWTFKVGSTYVHGIDSFELSTSNTEVDFTTFDDGGDEDSRIVRRSTSVKFTGKFSEDSSSGARDPGQAAVEVLGDAVGEASEAIFTMRSPFGTERTCNAHFSLDNVGGANNDPTKWGFSIKRKGPWL